MAPGLEIGMSTSPLYHAFAIRATSGPGRRKREIAQIDICRFAPCHPLSPHLASAPPKVQESGWFAWLVPELEHSGHKTLDSDRQPALKKRAAAFSWRATSTSGRPNGASNRSRL
jgi:hypothetical protein